MGTRSLHFLWLFGGQSLIKYDINSYFFVVATVFIRLMVCSVNILQSGGGGGGGGGLIREIKIPVHKLELKLQVGLCTRGGGGCNRGILRYMYMYNVLLLAKGIIVHNIYINFILS